MQWLSHALTFHMLLPAEITARKKSSYTGRQKTSRTVCNIYYTLSTHDFDSFEFPSMWELAAERDLIIVEEEKKNLWVCEEKSAVGVALTYQQRGGWRNPASSDWVINHYPSFSGASFCFPALITAADWSEGFWSFERRRRDVQFPLTRSIFARPFRCDSRRFGYRVLSKLACCLSSHLSEQDRR